MNNSKTNIILVKSSVDENMRFSSSPLFVAGVMSSPAWPLSGHVGQILLDVLCNIQTLFWPGIFAILYSWHIVPFILIGMLPQKQSLTIISFSYDQHLQEMILIDG